jgi:hypothetical protein
MRFIHRANSNYKSYLTHLRNSYLDGNNIYRGRGSTLTNSAMLLKYKKLSILIFISVKVSIT